MGARQASQHRVEPTFSFLVECCRAAFSGESASAAELIPALDWHLLLMLARRHRVEGLVEQSLRAKRDVPPEVATALHADAVRIAADGLRNARESARLHIAFSDANIPLVFIKGATLGKLVYGNPFVKMGWDIDVLVDASDILRAATILNDLGYVATVPGGGIDVIEGWHRTNKESVWRAENGCFVELHSRLADSPGLISDITVQSPCQLVEVTPGVTLPTLAPRELFAYLSVHGSWASWFRLKWAADFAGLVHSCTPDQVVDLAGNARALGAGRCMDEALLVCARLFGSPFIEAAAQLRLERSILGRLLARIAWSELQGPRAVFEPTERPLGTATLHLANLLLGHGMGFAPREIARKVTEQVTRRRYS